MKKLIIFSMLLLSFCGGEAVQNEIVQTTEVTEMTYDKTYTSKPEMSIDVNSTYTAELETSFWFSSTSKIVS